MDRIALLRQSSRKLVRELGILQLDKSLAGRTVEHCHAIVEIAQNPGVTVKELGSLLLLSPSQATRLVQRLIANGFVSIQKAVDKREKALMLTALGTEELERIDTFSKQKIEGAFGELTEKEQSDIIQAIEKYAHALEQSRQKKYKILTLSTSRTLRKQIVSMVEAIQKNEFQIPVTKEINSCILRAEEAFYYNNSYNFWYAVTEEGDLAGCIGLKMIDKQNGELKKLFVKKEYRGKGVAKMLLQTLLKAAKKHGFSTIWLGTVDVLTEAKSFYEKHYFMPIQDNALPKTFEKCLLDTNFYRLCIQ